MCKYLHLRKTSLIPSSLSSHNTHMHTTHSSLSHSFIQKAQTKHFIYTRHHTGMKHWKTVWALKGLLHKEERDMDTIILNKVTSATVNMFSDGIVVE